MPRAIARSYKRLGVMPCLVCGREIPVKKTDGGKLSCACQWCDAPIYVNAGSLAEELILRRVTLDAPPAAATVAAGDASSSKAPATSPAPASKASPAGSSSTTMTPAARRFTGPLGNPFGS